MICRKVVNRQEKKMEMTGGNNLGKFIYCIDESIKEKLIKKGYKLINENKTSNKKVWIFENKGDCNFSQEDKSKLFFTNRLTFQRRWCLSLSDKKVFICYSTPLMKYLTNNGFRYEVVGLNPKNKNTFWVFLNNNQLDKYLKNWKYNNPNNQGYFLI